MQTPFQPTYFTYSYNKWRFKFIVNFLIVINILKRNLGYCATVFFPHGTTAPVGQGLLIIGDSRSHSDTPHSVGLSWTSDQPDTENFAWQHRTLTRHPCPRQDSNTQSQQASDRRPTPYTARPLGSVRYCVNVTKILYYSINNKIIHSPWWWS